MTSLSKMMTWTRKKEKEKKRHLGKTLRHLNYLMDFTKGKLNLPSVIIEDSSPPPPLGI